MNYIEPLQDAIRRMHGCASVHVRSEPVTEAHKGKTVWQGVVEVFDLQGHPTAKRCYAWSHAEGRGDKGTRFVAVLEIPPVDSAQAAVRAAIVQEYRSAAHVRKPERR